MTPIPYIFGFWFSQAPRERTCPRAEHAQECTSGPASSIETDGVPASQLSDHTYDGPRSPSTLNRRLMCAIEVLGAKRKKLKTLQKKSARLKTRVTSMEAVLEELQKKQLVSKDAAVVLRNTMSSVPLELNLRAIKNNSGKLTKEQYPPCLRMFALTLQFYSTKAYEYVRETFALALPHQSTLRTWYSAINGEPGFTQEAFEALKRKVEEANTSQKQVVCSLMIDEMAIRKHLEWDGERYRGFVDMGIGMDDDSQPVATEALVFLVVALDASWKVPCAYFLINSLTGPERANIVKVCLQKLHDIGVLIPALVCDGLRANISMFEALGAHMRPPIVSCFGHPSNSDFKVHIILDACHMLKLLRNTLATLKVLKDGEGREIKWAYLTALHDLQEREGLRAGNKLKTAHVKWESQKMKVSIAAQTISASVADALTFCNEDLRLPQFAGVAPTVNFIKKFDRLFDTLNSRNPCASSFKAPIRHSTKYRWKPFFGEMRAYITSLTDNDGKPLLMTNRKTAFLGLLIAMESVESLCECLLGGPTSLMRYLLTYKLSQEHLELLFCAIRSKGGWNNNPTAGQFKAAYKRMLVHHEIEAGTAGNCKSQDTTVLMTVTASRQRTANMDELDLHEARTLNLFYQPLPQADDDHDYDSVPSIESLSLYVENAVYYISGYVIRMVRKKTNCLDCIDALEDTQVDPSVKMSTLLRQKNRGGLVLPSNSVTTICSQTEKCFRRMLAATRGQLPKGHKLSLTMTNAVLYDITTGNMNLFPSLQEHQLDSSILDDHVSKLIKWIVECYSKIRFHHLAKKATEKAKGAIIGKKLSHLKIRVLHQ